MIVHQVLRRFVPRERFAELLRRPRCRGWSVTAMCTTRRRSCATITSTNRSLHVAVGTTKKSAAAICWAWFAKKVRHDCNGDAVGRGMYFATVA